MLACQGRVPWSTFRFHSLNTSLEVALVVNAKLLIRTLAHFYPSSYPGRGVSRNVRRLPPESALFNNLEKNNLVEVKRSQKELFLEGILEGQIEIFFAC